jgi:hypothetical protein
MALLTIRQMTTAPARQMTDGIAGWMGDSSMFPSGATPYFERLTLARWFKYRPVELVGGFQVSEKVGNIVPAGIEVKFMLNF